MGVGSPEIVVTDGCKLPYECWELNLQSAVEQHVLLTANPSL